MADERDTQDERERREREDREREGKERGFKVEDRRRFTAEGQARPEPREKEPTSPTNEEASRPRRETQPHDAAPRHAGADAEATAPELSFTSFVIGIASQAFVFLGVMPDPQSGAVRKDLPQANAMIDILSMLSEKTAGNLDEQEAHMMSEMLYELRMLYVKELRAGTPHGGKT